MIVEKKFALFEVDLFSSVKSNAANFAEQESRTSRRGLPYPPPPGAGKLPLKWWATPYAVGLTPEVAANTPLRGISPVPNFGMVPARDVVA
jgi:hypothetical protein